jgi:hypothetical protein
MSSAITVSCTILPFTFVISFLVEAPLLKCCGLTKTGPTGANLSKALAKKNCPPELFGSWKKRQDRSLPIV